MDCLIYIIYLILLNLTGFVKDCNLSFITTMYDDLLVQNKTEFLEYY